MQKHILAVGIDGQWYVLPIDRLDEFNADVAWIEGYDESEGGFDQAVYVFNAAWDQFEIGYPEGLEFYWE